MSMPSPAEANELLDIIKKLRILDKDMWKMRVEEMKLRIRTYDSISQDEQRVVTPEEFYILKESELQRWRQHTHTHTHTYKIDKSVENIIPDLMSFMESHPKYNNKHFRDILEYLFLKFKSTRNRIARCERVGISSFVWPLPLETNISDFIEYVDGLEEPSPEGQGKYRKAKHKRKKSRRKRKHKRKKSRKKKSH